MQENERREYSQRCRNAAAAFFRLASLIAVDEASQVDDLSPLGVMLAALTASIQQQARVPLGFVTVAGVIEIGGDLPEHGVRDIALGGVPLEALPEDRRRPLAAAALAALFHWIEAGDESVEQCIADARLRQAAIEPNMRMYAPMPGEEGGDGHQ